MNTFTPLNMYPLHLFHILCDFKSISSHFSLSLSVSRAFVFSYNCVGLCVLSFPFYVFGFLFVRFFYLSSLPCEKFSVILLYLLFVIFPLIYFFLFCIFSFLYPSPSVYLSPDSSPFLCQCFSVSLLP